MIIKARRNDALQLAELHRAALPEELLSKLGRGFLMQMYQVAIDDPDSYLLIHKSNNRTNGFLFFSSSPSSFYKIFLKKKIHILCVPILIAMLKEVETTRLILSTLRYIMNTKYASVNEVMVLVVHPDGQRSGIGTKLLDKLEKSLTSRRIDAYNVKTTSNNEKANMFYVKNGFKKTLSFTIQNRLWVNYKKTI